MISEKRRGKGSGSEPFSTINVRKCTLHFKLGVLQAMFSLLLFLIEILGIELRIENLD